MLENRNNKPRITRTMTATTGRTTRSAIKQGRMLRVQDNVTHKHVTIGDSGRGSRKLLENKIASGSRLARDKVVDGHARTA